MRWNPAVFALENAGGSIQNERLSHRVAPFEALGMKTTLARVYDVLMIPITLAGAIVLVGVRRLGIQHMPLSRRVLDAVGAFPIRGHYYEPAFRRRDLPNPVWKERSLPGLDLNVDGQLELLEKLRYGEELDRFPMTSAPEGEFFYENTLFEAGDSEFLYSIIRHTRPQRIVEIGSGYSTLIACEAVKANQQDDRRYSCKVTCIEPYERAWLEKKDVTVLRDLVQDVDRGIFEELDEGDILFIDSSHIIRPGGDVLTEFLDVLPRVRPGVLVHVHDIFTPRDYPPGWIVDEVRFWNEQYLLEAFLTSNDRFQVVGALNFLAHNHRDALAAACPVFARKDGAEPGSFWFACRA